MAEARHREVPGEPLERSVFGRAVLVAAGAEDARQLLQALPQQVGDDVLDGRGEDVGAVGQKAQASSSKQKMPVSTWEMCRDGADFDLGPESIVAWGVTSGADIYCWVTADDDPDRWPVLVCGRHTSPEMQLHHLGMAEFLLKLLSGEAFQQETISVVLPGEASFVNWRNE
ncbi:hypothetical protein [Streptomyces sp. NBC_01353]|uniref:hypothetical protein n=1 Tax=Streptomyces sp. NBC_01353 TaxID=2903835 RepID=UPI002E31742E|nr:hypothetical protein [Streptomyces sp. NBC_01353]